MLYNMKKTTTTFTLALVLSLTLVSLQEIRIVNAGDTIYIGADGTVDGTDKLYRDGNVYTFTGNIYDPIVVVRDNIVVDGAGYTLQGNGSYTGIRLQERNSVTVRNVEISGFSTGIMLGGSSNTIIGNNITNNDNGFDIQAYSSYNTVSGNSIRNNNDYGIRLGYLADGNNIHGNTIANNINGIWLWRSSSYNTVSGNRIAKNSYGIRLEDSSNNNNIYENIIITNDYGVLLAPYARASSPSNNNMYENDIMNNNYGIKFQDSANNTIHGNTITNNDYGILLDDSSNNSIDGNNIITNNHGIHVMGHWPTYAANNQITRNNLTKNNSGISFVFASNNTLRENRMVDNEQNFIIDGSELSYFIHDVDTSNTVNSKPMYYLVNQRDKTIPSDAGYVALVNCTAIKVQNLELVNAQGILFAYTRDSTIIGNFVANTSHGIYLLESSSNTISGNSLTNNDYGIYFDDASDNTLSGNNVANNGVGIYFGGGVPFRECVNNTFYYNNFINNAKQINDIHLEIAFSAPSLNIWDDGEKGNYWSDYNGTDYDVDGIGDTLYVIDENNQDNYPLMEPVPVIPEFPPWIIIPLFLVATSVIVLKKISGHLRSLES
jgi:parallel beta-helix repeat protein